MQRTCRVCGYPHPRAIDAAIRKRASGRDIVPPFGLSRSSVARHAAAHLPTVRQKRPDAVTSAQGSIAALVT
jgi:hypothetical protein